MENHQGTVTGRRNGDTPACRNACSHEASLPEALESPHAQKVDTPVCRHACVPERLFRLTYTPNNPLVDRSFSKAKHSGVQAWGREAQESFIVSCYYPLSMSFLNRLGI
jgi:hypothetical protein